MERKRIGGITGVLLVFGLLIAPDLALAQTIKLKYHEAFAQAGYNLPVRWWMDEVEKRTEGKVKFDRIWGGALGKLSEQPMAIKAGSFDLGQVSCVYNPGLYPTMTLTILPFLGDNVLAHAKAAHDYFQMPVQEARFTVLNQKYMMNGVWLTTEMMSHDPVRTIDHMRKIKTRAHGGAGDALKALGITTYAVPWGELPAAAERRVVDAAIMGCPVDAYDFGFGSIFSYWERIKFYYMPYTLVINMDTWNKLPANVQQVMNDVNKIMPTKAYELYRDEELKAEKSLLAGGRVKIVQFEEMAKLKAEAGKPVWDKWVADSKTQGVDDGRALLDTFLKLLKKYE